MSATDFVNLCLSKIGCPYVYGASGPNQFDCSGLVFWAAGRLGISVPRTTQGEWDGLQAVESPILGDLILFDVPSDGSPQPQHVGVYLGNGQMVEAPHTGANVCISTIPNIPGIEWPMGYRRIPFPQPPPPPPPKPVERGNMIARNTHGQGFWMARPDGNVYADGGAPYLGPLPKYVQAWGMGTTRGPVVGICDDGVGGYVLACDNGTDATPSYYHITSDGAFAK